VQESYRFGRAELRPDARQLLIDGEPTGLGARAFDMLRVLIERRGRVVHKAELFELVWPGRVIEENNLQVHMSHLRKLLGPQAIATVPGRGYRFDAQVEVTSRAPRAELPEQASLGPPASNFFGREDDLVAVARLCTEHRLVTIVGAGGIGKTRVAQAVAQREGVRYPGGVVWVDLAVISDLAVVPAQFAMALGITLVPSVDPHEAMAAQLRGRAMLVVIDNAEHLVDAVCRTVGRLLAAAADLRVLVTSQQPLRLADEYLYRIGALSYPALPCSVDEARRHGAVALLCERANALDRRFELTDGNVADIVRICKHLDGLPLAIELAAGRLPLLGARGLLEHLDASFEVLATGARDGPTRQQTLRATFEWSHALLSDDEKRVLRRVAVSVGGFDLELARRLASDGGDDDWTVLDALGGLVDRSWVAVNAASVPRYSLAETGRSYGLLMLQEAGELDTVRRRHGRAIWQLMDQAFGDFWTMGDDAYVTRYAPELDNFRAAMGWAREGEPVWYVAIAGSAIPLLRHLSLIREGVEYLAMAQNLVTDEMPLAVRARLALSSAMLGGGLSAAERTVALHEQLGDPIGLFLSCYWLATRNDVPTATIEAMVATKRRIENPAWPGKVLSIGRGIEEELMYRQGRYADALRSIERRVQMCEAMGARDSVTSALMYKVVALFGSGDVEGAVGLSLRVADRCSALKNSYRLACCQAYAVSAMLVLPGDRVSEARSLARAFADLDRTLGWPHVCDAADGWTLLAAMQERFEDAALLLGFADAVHRSGEIARDALADAVRERAAHLLEIALPPARRDELAREGRLLKPDDAARLALPSG
jgi:predicted ATPase